MTVPQPCVWILIRFGWPRPCRNMGKVQRGGHWFCGHHDPEKKARQKAQPKIRGGAS